MKATAFEDHHRTSLHLLIVGLALAAYTISPDDIVWALVRHHSNSSSLERLAFGGGTLVFIVSALLETRATAYFRTDRLSYGRVLLLSRLLFAFALGLLLPLLGAVFLVLGETVLVVRLFALDHAQSLPSGVRAPSVGPAWLEGFRKAASKWGIAMSMIVFTMTLKDRVAEIGAGISFLIWIALNLRHPQHLNDPEHSVPL